MILSEVVVLVQSAEVVDLARVVEVMLDNHRDNPVGFLRLVPTRQAKQHRADIIVVRRLLLSCSAFYYKTRAAVYGHSTIEPSGQMTSDLSPYES